MVGQSLVCFWYRTAHNIEHSCHWLLRWPNQRFHGTASPPVNLVVGPQKRKADLLSNRVLSEHNLSHDPKQLSSGPSSRKACGFVNVSPSACLAALRRKLVAKVSAASFQALQHNSRVSGSHETPESIQGFGGRRQSRRARRHEGSSSPGNLVAQPGAAADVQPFASLRAARG